MLFPFLVILPGMIAIALTYQATKGATGGFELPPKNGSYDYDLVIPYMLGHYFPTGMLGLGMTALMASFMSGHGRQRDGLQHRLDLRHLPVVHREGQERRPLPARRPLDHGRRHPPQHRGGLPRQSFNNIMDVLQLVFAFVNAPLFATFLLGMFWKRATGHGAFWGLFLGTAAAAAHHGLTVPVGAMSLIKGGWLGHVVHTYPSEMAQNFWTAIWAFCTCFVATILISLATTSRRRTPSCAASSGR
jgi:SSS family solute:Na+ symporter